MCKCTPTPGHEVHPQPEQESVFRTVFSGRVRLGGIFRRSLSTKKGCQLFWQEKVHPPDKILATPMHLTLCSCFLCFCFLHCCTYVCACTVMNGYASSPAYSALSPIHNGPSPAAAGTLIPLGATFPAVKHLPLYLPVNMAECVY